jgi:hypothetical protein
MMKGGRFGTQDPYDVDFVVCHFLGCRIQERLRREARGLVLILKKREVLFCVRIYIVGIGTSLWVSYVSRKFTHSP